MFSLFLCHSLITLAQNPNNVIKHQLRSTHAMKATQVTHATIIIWHTHTPRCPCFIGSCKNWLNVCIFLQTKSPRRATEEEERRLKLLSKVLASRPPRETCIRCQLLGRQPPSETCTVHRVPLLLWNPSEQCSEIFLLTARKSNCTKMRNPSVQCSPKWILVLFIHYSQHDARWIGPRSSEMAFFIQSPIDFSLIDMNFNHQMRY